MQTPFGAPWDQLRLGHLEDFFRDLDLGAEGLTWEAKGREWPNAGSVRKHACGFANQLGGFLVVGVEETEAGWTVSGVEQMPQPRLWLTSVTRSGLSPIPFVDARAFKHRGKVVAVLRVDQVAAPPCMTNGRVFQRVTGATEPVTDPSVLAGLIERGRAADQRALDEAEYLSDIAKPMPGQLETALTGLAVAVAPVAVPGDARNRVFTRGFERVVIEELRRAQDFLPNVALDGLITIRHQAHETRVTMTGREAVWAAECTVSGAVAVVSYQQRYALARIEFAETLGEPLEAVARLVHELGGSGPAWMAVAHWSGPKPPMIEITTGSKLPTVVRRIADLHDTGEIDRGDLLRQLDRAAGRSSYEPEGSEA